MALLKTDDEIKKLREGGRILGQILALLASRVKPGVSTWDLEAIAREEIKKAGAEPAFLGYQPSSDYPAYPAALCASIDNQVVHCAPDKNKVLKSGEIISLDLGIKFGGLFTDAAVSVSVGKTTPEAARLLAATSEALGAGIGAATPGNTVGDIAAAVEAVGRREHLGKIG